MLQKWLGGALRTRLGNLDPGVSWRRGADYGYVRFIAQDRVDAMGAVPHWVACAGHRTGWPSSQPPGKCANCCLCPDCAAGLLVAKTAKDTGKAFIGCNRYPTCRFFKGPTVAAPAKSASEE